MLPTYPREDMQRPAGRNDPCLCGSGKKYKRCCLPLQDERRRWEPLEERVRVLVEEFVHAEKFDDEMDRASLLFGFEKDRADLAEERLFYDWYIHDYLILQEGKSLIRLLLEKEALTFDEETKRTLGCWASSTFSFLEVLDIRRGTGFRVKDLFRGTEEYFVWDVSGSYSLSKYDILFSRPYPVGPIVRIASGSFALPYRLKSQVEGYVEAGYHDFNKDRSGTSGTTIDDYLRGESLSIIKYLRTVLSKSTPTLVTSEGDILLFSSCEYTISDPELTVKLLDSCEELVDVGEENGALRYDWVTKEESEIEIGDSRQKSIHDEPFKLQTYLTDEESGEEMMVLGNLSLRGTKLGVSCASERRLRSCKSLVEKLLGKLVVGCSEERYVEPSSVSATEEKSGEHEEIPPDVGAKIAEKFFDEYYTKWLGKKVAALGNLTPLEASRTSDGREKLEEMLKLAENDAERSDGKLKPPIAKLRAALGL
jgi:hypothetical protein